MRDEHLSQMILARASRAPRGVAFRVKRGDAYADVLWSEVTPRLDAIAAGLLGAATLDDGACVSIVGNTSMESVLVDFAALRAGLRTVPVYASLLPEEVGYMHVDTRTQLVVVENRDQLEKVRLLRRGFTFVGTRCQTPLRTDPVTPLNLTPSSCSVVGLRRAENPGSLLLS